MVFRALFTQSQAKCLAVKPFDLYAFPLAITVTTATVRVRLFQAQKAFANPGE